MTIILNAGQENAIKQIHEFLNSDEQCMVISGPAGTGKTTVVKHVVGSLEKYYKTRKLLNMDAQELKIVFTATTNKACEALMHSLGAHNEVRTIHSHLRLVMSRNPQTFKDELSDSDPNMVLRQQLIFIDEASFIDDELLDYILSKVGPGTKVIFMGDPAQLKSPGSENLPVFNSGFREVHLTEIMRQDKDNPIQALSAALRECVLNRTKLPPCNWDQQHIHWYPREEFNRIMLMDMSNPEWTYSTSKLLAFRNKRVQEYNKTLNEKIVGTRNFQAGDYAVNNHYVRGTKSTGALPTDRTVFIDEINESEELGVKGHRVYLNGNGSSFFLPDDHTKIDRKKNALIRNLTGDFAADKEMRRAIDTVTDTWVDLRPVFAQTVNKSQGSTYRRVYIDLADLSFCRDYDQKIRLLYVAISRAQMQVFLTGDL